MNRQKVRQEKGSKAGGSAMLLIILAPAAIVFMPTTIIFCLGMVPTFVAWFIDRDPEKSAPMTVGSLNLCGVLPFLITLWQAGHTMDQVLNIMVSPVTWLTMYGAAGIGWGFYFVVPPLIAKFLIMRGQSKINGLEQSRRDLIMDWGPEVAIKAPEPVKPTTPAKAPR